MTVHVLNPAGPVWVLASHPAWDHDWTSCGTTSAGAPCMARSTSTMLRCPKESAVRLAGQPGPVELCGGHFGVHRRGKVVTLMVTWVAE